MERSVPGITYSFEWSKEIHKTHHQQRRSSAWHLNWGVYPRLRTGSHDDLTTKLCENKPNVKGAFIRDSSTRLPGHAEPPTPFLHLPFSTHMGHDSAVGIATRYWLDGPGNECQWKQNFPHPSRLALRPTQPSIQREPVLFSGGKAAWTWHWPPTPSSAEVKVRVQLYLYFPMGLRCLF
jgi:hypothetical protein